MTTAQKNIERGYKAILSTKHEVKLDPNEIDVVMKGAGSGTFIRVRQGLINPSYLVAIVEDTERRALFIEDSKYDTDKRLGGMKPIRDIFAKNPLQIKPPTAGG